VPQQEDRKGEVYSASLGAVGRYHIINQIKQRIAVRVAKAPRGPGKQDSQEFYNPAVDNIERFKDAYRNHVMHTRREYTGTEALAIFDQVRHFMMRLAPQISEC